MDPGDYRTNTLLIVSASDGLPRPAQYVSDQSGSIQNNISSVAFKLYKPWCVSFADCPFERTLRRDGHLVYFDPLRHAVWCFSLGGSEESSSGHLAVEATMEACGYNPRMVYEGILEPISLFKNRMTPLNTTNTPSSSSPSGPGLDTMLRPATPGGTVASSNFTAEADVKSSFGSTVELKGYGSITPKDIHKYFVASVLASLSQRFCSQTGAIPIDSKSFTIPPEVALTDPETSHHSNPSTFASLRVHLTTAGSLLISISLTPVEGVWASHDKLCSSPPQSGSIVLAAPLGIVGTLQAPIEYPQYPEDDSTDEYPEAQAASTRLCLDEQMCDRMLEMRNMSKRIPGPLWRAEEISWLSIQFLRPKPNESRSDGKRTPLISPQTNIRWPAMLCYIRRTRKPMIIRNGFETGHARFKDDFDVLKNAQTWFVDSAEREELLFKRKKDREAAVQSKDSGEADHRLLPSGFSPVAPRRTSNTGVGGGAMYPTPPDGVQNAAGVTPSIDGTTSSPGNAVPSSAMVDINNMDTSMTVPGSLGDAFGDGWDGSEVKREQSFNQENWDLNNDVFVENDITDADFNFFDDENPSGVDVNVSELPDIGGDLPNAESSQPPAILEPQRPSSQNSIKTEASTAPLIFAKPELKHARSILRRHRDQDKTGPSNGIKRHASPFDPTTVYKKLKLSLTTIKKSIKRSAQRGNAYEKLDFDTSFTAVNKKYEHNGRFDFPEDQHMSDVLRKLGSPPTTDYLRRHGRARNTCKEVPVNLGAQVAGMAGTVEIGIQAQSTANADESTSDADDTSLVSDQDDVSDFSDEPSSPAKASVPRRRLADDNESLAASMRDFEVMDDHFISGEDLFKLPINDGSELPVTRYFADPEPILPRVPLSDEEFIMVAQILTEQAVSGCLNYALPDSMRANFDSSGPRQAITRSIRSSVKTLEAILPPCLQAARVCQLRQLINVEDVPLLATPSRIQPRPPGGGPEQRPSLVQIAPPHLHLRRYDTKLSVLPSAVNFWESLGLGPSQGPKDIHSVCVFPNLDGMADSAGVFQDRLRSVYESMKLGSFERMPSSPNIPNGLLPFEVDKATNTATTSQGSRSGQPLVDDMAKLAVAIFNSTSVSRNFIVFFVYTPENPGTIVESCLAFQRMFELYRRALTERKKTTQNELVLQLVPLDFVASSTSMVVLSPGDCIRMCLEVYDRCTLFGGPMPSPAIVLEQQPVTQGINFQLRNQPSANVLQENSVMHIAYSQSVDDRWITAAWTDSRGSKQMTASYCLGRKGKPLSRSFAEIAQEIWTTTHDLTSIKVHWRIVITKVGAMDQQEISEWTALAQTETKISLSLALLTVDTNPSLQLIPGFPGALMTGHSVFYSTPVSTPQPSTMSPEAGGNPPTPKGPVASTGASTPGADNITNEADGDATLVDVTDTTWGAVLSHRLNILYSLSDPSPALISGYLIKRGGMCDDDPPAVMEINVVYCEGNPRVHEVLMREMLSAFRGLGTIAMARSVTEKKGDVRPWHVAAAEKGVRALYQLM